jgi:hypothetical protein
MFASRGEHTYYTFAVIRTSMGKVVAIGKSYVQGKKENSKHKRYCFQSSCSHAFDQKDIAAYPK